MVCVWMLQPEAKLRALSHTQRNRSSVLMWSLYLGAKIKHNFENPGKDPLSHVLKDSAAVYILVSQGNSCFLPLQTRDAEYWPLWHRPGKQMANSNDHLGRLAKHKQSSSRAGQCRQR